MSPDFLFEILVVAPALPADHHLFTIPLSNDAKVGLVAHTGLSSKFTPCHFGSPPCMLPIQTILQIFISASSCAVYHMAMAAKKVAVFDIDGTIIRSSLFVELVEELVRRKVLPDKMKTDYDAQYKKWIEREGSYDDYIWAMVQSFKKNIKGVFYGDVAETAKDVVKEQQKRTYRYTRDLIEELKKKNYFLLAISHSPKTILDYFCPRMGFDKAYGFLYDIGPEDNFTGEVIDEHLMANKANILKRAVEKESLSLEGSIGVGDTESDISFLELVEKPICFNPNAKLYKHAKVNKWKVVVERKDVIYEL